MLDCCILFLFHEDNWTTAVHRRLLRELNPYPVISLYRGAGGAPPGAVDLVRIEPESFSEDAWSSADAALTCWFRCRAFDARRYIFLEWDALLTVPVRDYYRDVWDRDVAAANVLAPESHSWWQWFSQTHRLPAELQAHAAGLSPLNGLLLSHRALGALAASDAPRDVFSEFRVATILKAKGFSLTQVDERRGKTNSFQLDLRQCALDEPGMYHPVKEAVLAPDDFTLGAPDALRRLTNKAALARLAADYRWPAAPPDVPLDMSHGWLDGSTAGLLASSLSERTTLVVELGSWLGLSTRFIANRAPHATVVAIDHWRGSPEHHATPEWAAKLEKLYETFLVNCWNHRERVVPLSMLTRDALHVLSRRGLKPELVYIDADHTYDVVAADLRLSLELFPDATIVGDDWAAWPAVSKAVQDVTSRLGVCFEVSGNAYRIPARTSHC